ncbi:MAG: M28 family metallopeptidase [Anaerolineae bacterium]
MSGRMANAREERLLRSVRDIVAKCGPRPSGSDGERTAAQYMADKFRALGLDVHLDEVQMVSEEHLPEIVGYALVILAAIVLTWSPPIAAALAIAGTAVLFTEAAAIPTVSRLLPKRTSYNVVARRGGTGTEARTIVLVAHLDSGRPTLLTHPRAVLAQRQSFVFAINAAGIVFVVSLFGIFSPISNVWWVAFACGLYLIAHVTITIYGLQTMAPSPGANDNASGLAVLLEAAEQLGSLRQTDLWLVATCGHDAGLAGMRNFLAKYPLRRDRTGVINVQAVGAGTISLTLVEGFVRNTGVSRRLLEAAANAVRDAGLTAQARAYQGSNTEAYLALRSRLPALSIIGFDRRGAIPNWHWRTDTVDNIDASSLDTATRLVTGTVTGLDAEVPTAPRPPVA